MTHRESAGLERRFSFRVQESRNLLPAYRE